MNAIESDLGTYSSFSNTSHFGCFNGSVRKVNICEFWNKFREYEWCLISWNINPDFTFCFV